MLVYSMVNTRQRALELGWQMSRRYRESEERFRALNELLPALVMLADADGGRITYANQASRNRLGDRITDQRLPELFDDDDLHRQLQARDTSGCGRMEAQLRDAGGERLRSEEHTSELQSLMRISYAVF